MSLANLKATTEYQEAIQATEDIESPAVGFAKTSDYKGGLTNQVNAVIKQNNTLLYLASKQSQKLIELEEKFDRLKQKVYTIIEKEIQPADLEDSISSLAKRLDNFSISGKIPVKRTDGKIHTTELPTQEDQIRGYRAMTRGRYQAARATRRVFGRNNYNITLESVVDPERQLELSRERRANLVPAEVLYSNNRSTARHRVYQHYSEQRILCINDNQTNLPLCNQQSYQSLRTSGLQHIHLGIFMIRLHALHRRSAGTNALVVLRDTRWEDSRQIIGTMEVDLSAGTQLVYMFPDMVLSIDDFHNHVEVAIQTHGYDTWQGGESNLLVTMAMIGRLSNTSYMGFQYSVDNVVDHLTTTGITAIPGERRSVEELEGMSWNLKPSEQTTVRVPSRVAVNERLNRSLSLQFERYRRAPQPARYSVDQHDREILGDDHLDEDEEHFIGICLQDPQTQHIPCDICFCEDCLNEARTLEEEPLNKAKRSNKPKRSKQRSWEKWSTLGEPSGKWDYYVRYDTPTNTVPIEEITATGWGDEFSDSEATPGKVTILDQKDDWDDDERGGGKILHKSEMECENPFAAKRGEDHTVLHLSKNEEKDDDLPYPKFRKFKQLAAQIINKHEEHAFPIAADDTESSTSYQPPPDAIIGPAVYPSARQIPQPTYKPDYQFGYRQGKGNTFYEGYGEYHNSQWTLPPAWTESRVMLVLPTDPGLWSDVISRWESITINRLNSKTWFDNKVKLAFVEKLLGEREKLMWQQWRTAYPEVYSALETIADEPQILGFLTGKLYFPSTTEKLFAKLPPSLSKKIEESFKAKHPGLSAGVLPAIKFTYTFVSEICKDAVLAKELWAYPFVLPYQFLVNTRIIGRNMELESQEHIKEIRIILISKQDNIARSVVYQELDLDDNWDIVLADFDDSSVYSISEGEGFTLDHQQRQHIWFNCKDREARTRVTKPNAKVREHDWKKHETILEKRSMSKESNRINQKGKRTSTIMKAIMQRKEELWQSEKILLIKDLTDALKIIDQLKTEQIKFKEQKDEEIRKLKAQLQKEKR
ncbi:hypothetical protein Tco_1548238 [Tanacetum coccineum]